MFFPPVRCCFTWLDGAGTTPACRLHPSSLVSERWLSVTKAKKPPQPAAASWDRPASALSVWRFPQPGSHQHKRERDLLKPPFHQWMFTTPSYPWKGLAKSVPPLSVSHGKLRSPVRGLFWGSVQVLGGSGLPSMMEAFRTCRKRVLWRWAWVRFLPKDNDCTWMKMWRFWFRPAQFGLAKLWHLAFTWRRTQTRSSLR